MTWAARALLLALAVLTVPIGANAQPADKVQRVGILAVNPLPAHQVIE